MQLILVVRVDGVVSFILGERAGVDYRGFALPAYQLH